MEIKVLIADQERTFAEALAARLDDEEDIKVMGAVQVRTPGLWLTAGKPVDVLVLDGDLPDGAADRLCAEVADQAGSARVITLSSSFEPERIVNAIRAGVAAWVRKDQSLKHLLQAIRGVALGETWLPPSETGNVLRLLLRERDRHRDNECLLAALTPRERAVLDCLAEGAEHRAAVAEQLHLSVNTVRTHLQNLMAKLGVHSALEAVALTREQGDWLPPNDGTSWRCDRIRGRHSRGAGVTWGRRCGLASLKIGVPLPFGVAAPRQARVSPSRTVSEASGMMVRLLVFVQEATFADALATRLAAELDVDVMAALYMRALSPQPAAGIRADMVLLDGDLPGDAAFRLCEELRQPGDTPRIIFLSSTSAPGQIVRAIAAGAIGWVRKDESIDRLIEVIHGAARGETWLPPGEMRPVLQLLMGESMRESDLEQDDGGQLLAALTPREREVLACLAEGTNRRDLAEHLHMSPNTVRTHLQNLMSKLGVHSALEAVALTRSHLGDQFSERHLMH